MKIQKMSPKEYMIRSSYQSGGCYSKKSDITSYAEIRHTKWLIVALILFVFDFIRFPQTIITASRGYVECCDCPVSYCENRDE